MNRNDRRDLQKTTEARQRKLDRQAQGQEKRSFSWRWCLGAMLVAAILGSVGLTWAPVATYSAVPIVFLACVATLGAFALYHLGRYVLRKTKCSPSRS